MSPPSYVFLPWDGLARDQLYEILALRQRVFVVEQHCVYLDADGRDQAAWHLLGHAEDRLVAYARIFPPGAEDHGNDAVIGRVIVAEEARSGGLGMALMAEALRALFTTFGPQPVFLSAQAHLQAFYERCGFAVCGEGYDEDGIWHLPMRRARMDL